MVAHKGTILARPALREQWDSLRHIPPAHPQIPSLPIRQSRCLFPSKSPVPATCQL